MRSRHWLGRIGVVLALMVMAPVGAETLIITAEGLVDPSAAIYREERARLLDDLQRDARAQIVEKAITTLVEGRAVRQHYEQLQAALLDDSQRFIKRMTRRDEPTLGRDGFMHQLVEAEVDLDEVRSRLTLLSEQERVELIRTRGDPAISTAVIVKDDDRPGSAGVRSEIAENLLKEQLLGFGYRVWSEDSSDGRRRRSGREVDFEINGEATFRSVRLRLSVSKLEVRKFLLSSWTVKCTDRRTGEEIYFNNKIPEKRSWASKEAALRDVGALIAGEFSEEFFRQQLAAPTRRFEVDIQGLPEYELGVRFAHELIGLRSVVNAEFRGFDAEGLSLFEVEFAGSARDFPAFVNDDVLKPVNSKLGYRAFRLAAVGGSVVRVRFQPGTGGQDLLERMEQLPPTSLAEAPARRVRQVVQNAQAMLAVARMNPSAVLALAKEGDADAEEALEALAAQES